MKFEAGQKVKLSAVGLAVVNDESWYGSTFRLEDPNMVGEVVGFSSELYDVEFPQELGGLPWPMKEDELELVVTDEAPST